MQIVDFKTWINENHNQKTKTQNVNESEKLKLLEKAKSFNIYVKNLKDDKGKWFNIYDRKDMIMLSSLPKKDDYEIVDIDDEYGLGSLSKKYPTIKSLIKFSKRFKTLEKVEIQVMKFLIEEGYVNTITEAISKLDDITYYECIGQRGFKGLVSELYDRGIINDKYFCKHGYVELDEEEALEFLSSLGYEDEDGNWIVPEFDEDDFIKKYPPVKYPEFYTLDFNSLARDLRLSGDYVEISRKIGSIFIYTPDL